MPGQPPAADDPNTKETARGETALMFAANYNRVEAMRALLAKGADYKATTKVVDLAGLTSPEEEFFRQQQQQQGGGQQGGPGAGRGPGGPGGAPAAQAAPGGAQGGPAPAAGPGRGPGGQGGGQGAPAAQASAAPGAPGGGAPAAAAAQGGQGRGPGGGGFKTYLRDDSITSPNAARLDQSKDSAICRERVV